MSAKTSRSFESGATITASPAQVWAVLVDTGGWADWDSGVDEVAGSATLGSTIQIRSQAAPGRTFPVKVTRLDAPQVMEFTGGMPFGLFRGVRTYALEPSGSSTTFTMREVYSGPMLGMIWKSMPDLTPSFEQFAHGLKARVESLG